MWWVYGIGIITVCLVITFLIARVVRLPEMAPLTANKDVRPSAVVKETIKTDEELHEVVYEEIGGFVDSNYRRQELAKAVSVVVTRELDERVKKHTDELRTQYEKELAQRSQNEEIALKKYKKVLVEKESTEAVIRSIAEGLVVVDSSGKVIMMNPAAEKLLGGSKKEKIGTLLGDNLKSEHMLSLTKNHDGAEEKREIEVASTDAETKKVLRASSAVIENEKGDTIGMVSVLSDITKQKELDSLKSKFIASVSHELRTPLIAIDKSVSLLLTKHPGPVNETQEQFLSIAARNLKRLTNLINDLLDMSKLEAGKLSLNRKPSSIKEITHEVIQSLATWATTKQVTITNEIADAIPLVYVDADRIIQVFNNLIGNSLKFTPPNGTISIAASSSDGSVAVSVRDTGIGVSKEELSRIFDKFYQAEGRSQTDISGTGLGLTIVREIVELHGGRVWAESEVGKGMTISFTLPIHV